jgi:hypothetical protein
VTGTCLCGAVRFELTERFASSSICHCTNCKKISGGAGTVSGRVRTDAIRLTSGEEAVLTFQPAEGTAKSFCAICGSNLFGAGWPTSEWTSVRLSTLEDPVDARPDAHVFVRSLAAWETLPEDGLPRHEGPRPPA